MDKLKGKQRSTEDHNKRISQGGSTKSDSGNGVITPDISG